MNRLDRNIEFHGKPDGGGFRLLSEPGNEQFFGTGAVLIFDVSEGGVDGRDDFVEGIEFRI